MTTSTESLVDSAVTAVVLTYNEELHIGRCIQAIRQVARHVFVVDSFSTDRTVEIAKSCGAEVFQHPFVNHAEQLSWALSNLPFSSGWVMRIDADEILTTDLASEIRAACTSSSDQVGAFEVRRTLNYNGTTIRHGGFPHWVVRIWRTGSASVERRWMDEHVVVQHGRVDRLRGIVLDDNLNGLSWWIEKHNGYASREAVELLLSRHGRRSGSQSIGGGADLRRSFKVRVYDRMPLVIRPFVLFAYRMLIQAGLLDGVRGFPFHFLQCLWYRLIADLKVLEVERTMKARRMDLTDAIAECLKIQVQAK